MNGLTVYQQIRFEIVKLVLQLAGALFVARLTVKWALSRFKNEKSWERQLSAYTDVLSALSQMERALDKWIREIQLGSDLTPEQHQALLGTYAEAINRVDEVHAVADLVLPKATRDTLKRLQKDINTAQDDRGDWASVTLYEADIVTKARKEIVLQGQRALGVKEL